MKEESAKIKNRYLLAWVLLTIVIFYCVFKFAFPLIWMNIMGKETLLPTPSTLMAWYMIMVTLCVLVYVTTSDVKIKHMVSLLVHEKSEPLRHESEEKQIFYTEEGKILYQQNCRPCHGSKADGEGPWSNTFRLKPANFRDPGTIGTIVENYPVWRIKKGGPGLPTEATPWDSTMPPWEPDFTDNQIWKIIMGEYVTADVSPRTREVLHE